jgi:hypothetical protein
MSREIIRVPISAIFSAEVGQTIHHPVTNQPAIVAELLTAVMEDYAGIEMSGFFVRLEPTP